MKFKDLKIGDYFLFSKYFSERDDVSDVITCLKTSKTSYVSLDGEWEDDSFKNMEVIKLKPSFERLPEPILDEQEKKYLENVIRPWKNKALWIQKVHYYGDYSYIRIILAKNECDAFDHVSLPTFRKSEMYQGMKFKKCYTLKELGLFEYD